MNKVRPYLDKAGKWTVEQIAGIPHESMLVDLDAPRTGVLHTTEGYWASSMAVFKTHWAPHFILGMDETEKRVRICQLVQIGTIGAALVTHNDHAIVQIEMIGFSKETPWLPDAETADALSSLMAVCYAEYGIPLTRPWEDGDYGRYGDNPHRHAGVWGVKAGWFGHGDCPDPDCVVPETPILCADLSWRAAGDLKAGDEIVGFTEHQDVVEGIFDNRRLGRAIIEGNFIAPKRCVTVRTADGEVVSSADHPFLTRIRYRRNFNKGRNGVRADRWRWGWKRADELEPDDEIGFLTEPWKAELDYDAGWMAGFFDGEGCLSLKASKQFAVSAAQVLGPTADRLLSLLDKFGFRHQETFRHLGDPRHKDAIQVVLRGGRVAAMEFLGRVRPSRLIAKADPIWVDALVSRTIKKARVIDAVDAGMRDVASISTSSRTYIANGFMVHNSHWDPGNLEWSKLLAAANAMTDVLTAPAYTPPAEPPRPCAGAPVTVADMVTDIQKALVAHGQKIAVDGIMGPATRAAILKALSGS